MASKSTKTDRICLKLINDVQARTENLITQLQDPDWQTEEPDIESITSITDEMLSVLLTNLDLLESISQSEGGSADEIKYCFHIKSKERNILTEKVYERLQETLPDLYENIQEFLKEQSDNISDIQYMLEEGRNHSDENDKYKDAQEVLNEIEKGIRQLEDFYTIKEEEPEEVPAEKIIHHHHHYDMNAQYLTDLIPARIVSEYEANLSPYPVNKDGGPDMRYSVNKNTFPHLRKDLDKPEQKSKQIKKKLFPGEDVPISSTKNSTIHLKKDGTPDRRYRENKPALLKKGETPTTTTVHLKKDGTPDRRFKENKETATSYTSGPLKKDGTPDMRYSANKSGGAGRSSTPVSYMSGPLKKDGTPDMRYSANKSGGAGRSNTPVSYTSGPLKKDGTPDMRYSANKSGGGYYSGCTSYSSLGSSSYRSGGGYASSYCPGPLTKSGKPDMRYAANKAYYGKR